VVISMQNENCKMQKSKCLRVRNSPFFLLHLNSGFNIHNQVKIGSQDERGRESLAQYILRSPFSQEKMTYRLDSKTVKAEGEEVVTWKPEVIEVDPPPISKEFKKRWSYFIRKVYETDPLNCPKCQGEMRIISFIEQPEVIRKILLPEKNGGED